MFSTTIFIFYCALIIAFQEKSFAYARDCTAEGMNGECRRFENCPILSMFVNKLKLDKSALDELKCDYAKNIYCCPHNNGQFIDYITFRKNRIQREKMDMYHSRKGKKTKKKMETKTEIPSCGFIYDGPIEGGRNAMKFEFPWMALIKYSSKLSSTKCGGSVISNNFILTAAHCTEFRKPYSVLLGHHNYKENYVDHLNADMPANNEYFIEEIIMHEEFDPYSRDNDIALIKLKTSLIFDATIRPICLPTEDDSPKPRNAAIITGWGKSRNRDSHLILQRAVLYIKSCKGLRYSIQDNDKSKFCGGGTKRNSCQGDSGGPVQISKIIDEHLIYFQIGIISYGLNICALEPSVFTNLPFYVDWVKNKTGIV